MTTLDDVPMPPNVEDVRLVLMTLLDPCTDGEHRAAAWLLGHDLDVLAPIVVMIARRSSGGPGE